VPADNPFLGRKGARPEIFTYGNRNVQGADRDPRTGQIWLHEHGPQGGDEVNLLAAGRNYGWPVVTYGRNYFSGTKIGEGVSKPGMTAPVHQWTPSIAPSGLAVYRGRQFDRWDGDLLVGALKFQLLVRLRIRDNKVIEQERMLEGALGRIRAVEVGPDGYVYLLTDASRGRIVRLAPVSSRN
jgi:glucose/arabinose dehydrogenase